MNGFWFIVIGLAFGFNSSAEELFKSQRLTEPNGFTFGIEGPAVGPDGSLYVCSFKKRGDIGRVNVKTAKVEVALELPEGSIANGLRFDREGRLLIADYKKHNVFRYDFTKKKLETLAHDERMYQPNDLAVAPNGDVYASDPFWKKKIGRVWKISGDGRLSIVALAIGTANGIDISPDGQTLAVGESTQNSIWTYKINKDGLGKRKLFVHFTDFSLDGLRFDQQGRLYVARIEKGTIAILSPDGQLLREVKLVGKDPTNVAFGGPDGKTVYITQRDGRFIESFRVDIPGREWK